MEPAAPFFLQCSESAITFDQTNHSESVPQPGRYPLVVNLIIGMKRLTTVLMDGGNGLNIMYAETLIAMGIDQARIRPTERLSTASFGKAGHATWADRSVHHLWVSIQL